MKSLFLQTVDNIKLALNWYQTNHDEVIIVIAGWFMTKDSKAFSLLGESLSKDFDIITFDCRGHGKSSGFYTFTANEILDVKTVVDFAKQHYKKIYLMGFSLGGGLALIYAASNHDIDKIIAVSAHSDFKKIENKMWHPNAWRETLKKFELKRWLSVRPSLKIKKKIAPIAVVDRITVPTLFIAGAKDPTVCCWHTKSLYDKATCPKKFELFENGIHAEDLFLHEPERFFNLCRGWLYQEAKGN